MIKLKVTSQTMTRAFALGILCTTVCILPAKKEWTFLVYMAADNNLEQYSFLNQHQMETIGSNEFINILIYSCTDVQGQGKNAKKIVVNKNGSQVISVEPNVDSGSAQTLINACLWAIKSYPSNHFALVLWNHGAGWRTDTSLLNQFNFPLVPSDEDEEKGICFDDTTGHFLTDRSLVFALEQIAGTFGKKVDIIACDACLMASVEIAYALEPFADYFVASEETIPGEGWPYALTLSPFAKKNLSPDEFVRWMVDAYAQHYKNVTKYFTLSSLDLGKISPLTTNIHTVAQFLSTLIKRAPSTMYKIINASSKNSYCTAFYDPTFVDMHHFYANLLSNSLQMRLSAADQEQLVLLLEEGMSLMSNCVLNYANGSAHIRARGISIYLPQSSCDPLYASLLWSKTIAWGSFVKTYVGAKSAKPK